MKRVSPLLLLLAVAAVAPGCKRHKSSDQGVIAKAASVVQKVIEHPPNLFLPPADIFSLPDPSPVAIPLNGDVDPAHTKHDAVHVPGGSPAPHGPIHECALPKTHEGDAKAFECLGHDECYFPRMPFYNQGNPNFSRVNLPKDIYDADHKKITGPIQWDDKSQRWAILMTKKDGTQTLNPYYNTWLPMGPLSPQDDGYIGYWHTALCGPTSESMALMAALAAKGPHTRVRRGSWLEKYFIEARRPDDQAPLPNPLLTDHATLAPNHREMTAEELQRVINMAVRQRTSPMAGGGGSVFMRLADEFESDGGRPPVETRPIAHPTTNAIAEAIRDRFVPTIVMGAFKVSLQPVNQGGRVVKYVMTFKRHGGHFVAVNGFTRAKGKHTELLIYNPVYAKPVRQSIVLLPTTGVTKDGVPVEVSSQFGDKIGILEDVLANGDVGGLRDLGALKDGDDIHIVQHAQAVKIQ